MLVALHVRPRIVPVPWLGNHSTQSAIPLSPQPPPSPRSPPRPLFSSLPSSSSPSLLSLFQPLSHSIPLSPLPPPMLVPPWHSLPSSTPSEPPLVQSLLAAPIAFSTSPTPARSAGSRCSPASLMP